LLKRKLFTGDFIRPEYTDRSDLRMAMDYINDYLEYDVNLIWNHVLRTFHLGDIIDNVHLIKLMNCSKGIDSKISDKYGIPRCFHSIQINKNLFIVDEAEWDCSLFVCVETFDDDPASLIRSKWTGALENLAANRAYVHDVIEYFGHNPKLGMLVSPFAFYGRFTGSLEKRWVDVDKTEELYKHFSLKVPFDSEKAPLHRFNAMWCRKGILGTVHLEYFNKSPEIMMQLTPLIAQDKGYYTEVLYNETYVKYALSGAHTVMRELWNLESHNIMDKNLDQIVTEVMEKKIKAFSETHECVCVYGAGYLASKAIKIAELYTKVRRVFVSDKSGNADTISGYEIRSIADMERQEAQMGFIVAVGKKNNNVVAATLKALGVEQYIFL